MKTTTGDPSLLRSCQCLSVNAGEHSITPPDVWGRRPRTHSGITAKHHHDLPNIILQKASVQCSVLPNGFIQLVFRFKFIYHNALDCCFLWASSHNICWLFLGVFFSRAWANDAFHSLAAGHRGCLSQWVVVLVLGANSVTESMDHIISYHIISYHIISYHIISYHIISYHIISYIYIYIHMHIYTYIYIYIHMHIYT